ncbi:MAG: putative metal-binding motif-containing protein [Sandaracinaceae bacterium]|nr:putative metal-binding motif-containing protein [Sandaracinaceae bacterium]
MHGAQVEICDDLDNDCDTRVDEAPAAVTWYLDADDDGFGDPTMRRVSCEPQPGYSLRGTDCDDGDPDTNPSVRERCDGRDNNCNGVAEYVLGVNDFEDDDGDGRGDLGCVAVGGAGTDCDDRDPSTFPGATEICDRRDNDCNGMIDDGTAMGAWYPRRRPRHLWGRGRVARDVVRPHRRPHHAGGRLRRPRRAYPPEHPRALRRQKTTTATGTSTRARRSAPCSTETATATASAGRT